MDALPLWAPQPVHFNLPPDLFWLIWVGFFAFIALMLYAASRQRRKRQEAL